MIRVAAVPQTVSMTRFSLWLEQQEVVHEIRHEDGHQVLMIENEMLHQPVFKALEHYLDDPDNYAEGAGSSPGPPRRRRPSGQWQASPRQAPLTLGLILLAALVAWLTGFGMRDEMVAMLTFVNPFEYPTGSLDQRIEALTGTLASGQIWRLLTPDILHFSLMHLVFNAVMLWYLGSQIEVIDGRGHAIGVFLLSSLLANGSQFLISGPLFGGLSGVVYAVLGYAWISNQFRPRFQFPPALMTVAIVWLLIGFTPLTQVLLGANMANAAHLGGLIAGLIYGALVSSQLRQQ
ncbi:MAG: rhomboid family intramembrane serine protease [Halomonadaceae bacterium]|nr:MAG: rhomboid family intramembrane serine protease [Halomonadaceae bacterium]